MFQKVAQCAHSGPGVSPRGPELPLSKGKVTMPLRRAQQQQNKQRLARGSAAPRLHEMTIQSKSSLASHLKQGTAHAIPTLKFTLRLTSVTPRDIVECDNEKPLLLKKKEKKHLNWPNNNTYINITPCIHISIWHVHPDTSKPHTLVTLLRIHPEIVRHTHRTECECGMLKHTHRHILKGWRVHTVNAVRVTITGANMWPLLIYTLSWIRGFHI